MIRSVSPPGLNTMLTSLDSVEFHRAGRFAAVRQEIEGFWEYRGNRKTLHAEACLETKNDRGKTPRAALHSIKKTGIQEFSGRKLTR